MDNLYLSLCHIHACHYRKFFLVINEVSIDKLNNEIESYNWENITFLSNTVKAP